MTPPTPRKKKTESIAQRAKKARRGTPSDITAALHDPSVEVVSAALQNPFLQDEHMLILLNRKDLPGQFLEDIAKNPKLNGSQRVKAALVMNPKTPRLASIGLLKFLYLFDLVQVSLRPAVPAEIKRLADNQIIAQLDQLAVGRQVQLARRGSGRVAAAILMLGHVQVLEAALDNPFLTEGELYKVLQRDRMAPRVISAIAGHRKWSLRYDVRLQVIRHPRTKLATALEFIPRLRPQDLRLLVTDKRISENLREYLQAELGRRTTRRR